LTKKRRYYSKIRRRKEINLLSEKIIKNIELLPFGFGPIFIDDQT
jgi:hypothetical protein